MRAQDGYKGEMRKSLSFILILCACGDVAAGYPLVDASVAVDGAVTADAITKRPPTGDCMGNLPFSRTDTHVDGDPLAPALVDEIQDLHVGDRHTNRVYKTYLSQWVSVGGTGTAVCDLNPSGLSLDPVWKLTANHVYGANIPYWPGQTFVDFSIELWGNGAIDPIFTVWYAASRSAAPTQLASGFLNNAPAAWSVVGTTLPPTPHPLGDDGNLYLQIDTVPAAGGFLFVGAANVKLYR